jgi:hypothetical protein
MNKQSISNEQTKKKDEKNNQPEMNKQSTRDERTINQR